MHLTYNPLLHYTEFIVLINAMLITNVLKIWNRVGLYQFLKVIIC